MEIPTPIEIPTIPNLDYETQIPLPPKEIQEEIVPPQEKPTRKIEVDDAIYWDQEVVKRRRMKKPAPPIVDMGKPNRLEGITWEQHFDWLDTVAKRRESLSRTKESAEIKIESKAPVGIVLTSDWHIGSEGMDRDTFRRHMNKVLKEPNVFMAVLSNTIDGYIWPGGMLGEDVHIPEQIEIAKAFAQRFKEKLICAVGSRCHDWTKERGGVSPQEMSFLENIEDGMPFMPNGGIMTVDLNGIKYKFGLMHKSRFHSSLNVTNANKRMLDLRWPSADVIAIAHHHVGAVEHTTRWEGEDRRNVVLVRTGSYKVADGYSESEGFGQGQIGSSLVILDPNEKNIIPFYDFDDGMNYLTNLRELEGYKMTYGGIQKKT